MATEQEMNDALNEGAKKVDWEKAAKEGIETAKKNFKRPDEPQLNVFVYGKTGVGKSTLINTIFGKEVVKTGSGSPVTQHIQEIKIDDKFSIFDTKGLEIKDTSTVQNIKDELEEFATYEADKQIHVAWFCLLEANRRIEEVEIELYNAIKAQGYPVVVIVTQAERDKDNNGEKFSDIVKNKFGIDDAHFQRVRAIEVEDDEGEMKKIMGVNELVSKTYNLLDSGRANAFARKQRYDEKMRIEAEKKRKEEAFKNANIAIHTYATAAGTVAVSPIPFSDIALILPTQIAMIANISYIYDIDLDSENVKKLAVAFGGAVGAGFAARAAVGTLLKFIPGLGTIAGGAFNSATAFAVTELIGRAYVAYLNDNFELLYKDGFDIVSMLSIDTIKKYIDIVKS